MTIIRMIILTMIIMIVEMIITKIIRTRIRIAMTIGTLRKSEHFRWFLWNNLSIVGNLAHGGTKLWPWVDNLGHTPFGGGRDDTLFGSGALRGIVT